MTANSTLRTMFTKARDASVPLDTIERAIKRGTGELEGVRYEAVTYEGYAPSASRSSSNASPTTAIGRVRVRSLFSRSGGSMAEPGAVSWQFERKGVVMVPKSVGRTSSWLPRSTRVGRTCVTRADEWMVHERARGPAGLRSALDGASIAVDSADLEMVPTTRVGVADESAAKGCVKLIELLEEHDDVAEAWLGELRHPDESWSASEL